MVYYDIDSRTQFAREHADRLALEMRRSRRVTQDEAGVHRGTRLGSAFADRVERLYRGRGHHTPAYHA
jgi:hypothetical protein